MTEKEERYEDLEKQQGSCLCCGQIYLVAPLDPDAPADTLDHMATMKCTCNGAKDYQKLQESITRAKSNIRKLCSSDKIIELLTAAVDMVAEQAVASVSVNDGYNVRYRLSMTGAGKIKVEKSRTEKEALE